MVAIVSAQNYQKPSRFPSLLGTLHHFRRGFTRASPALHLRFTCASPHFYPLFRPMPLSFPCFSWQLQLKNDTLRNGMLTRTMSRLDPMLGCNRSTLQLPRKKTTLVTIMKDVYVFLSMVCTSHSPSLSPFRARNLAMRFGKLLQSPSTSRSLFTLSQHCFKRAAKASRVSSHAR